MPCRYLDSMKELDGVEKVPGFPDQEDELENCRVKLFFCLVAREVQTTNHIIAGCASCVDRYTGDILNIVEFIKIY